MAATITRTRCQYWPAVRLENGAVGLTVVPALGGKMVALEDLRTGRSWLWSNPHLPLRTPQPGRSYTREFDSGGWDEILPTVQPCSLNGTPWGEAIGNDHGLLWCRPWDEEGVWSLPGRGAVLDLFVTLGTVPCRFRRSIWLNADADRIDLSYELENQGGRDLSYLWAAHPLFPIEPGMRLELPPGTTARVTDAVGVRLPVPGKPFQWPLAPSATGPPVDLSHLGSHNEGGRAVKVFTESLAEGWARVVAPEGGEALEFRFGLDEIPCLGLWINDGGWSGTGSKPYRNLGVEPTTAPCDTLADAIGRGNPAIIPAGGARRWGLSVVLRTDI